MTNVTFGEKAAAGLAALVVVGIVVLAAVGSSVPQELLAIPAMCIAYLFGSRTSQPVRA